MPTTQLSTLPGGGQGHHRAGDVRGLDLVLLGQRSVLQLKLRSENGQRWVKITYFRDLDLLNTPQAPLPVDLVGEIIRATARMYPRTRLRHDVQLPARVRPRHQVDAGHGQGPARQQSLARPGQGDRGRLLRALHADARAQHLRPQLLRARPGQAEAPARRHGRHVFPQWAIGFDKPFQTRSGSSSRTASSTKVHGKSLEADIMRDMLVRREAELHELGCGFNPKYPRYKAYPAGSNSPGACTSAPTRKAQRVHASARAALGGAAHPPGQRDVRLHREGRQDRTLIDNGFLMALRDPKVVEEAVAIRRSGRAAGDVRGVVAG